MKTMSAQRAVQQIIYPAILAGLVMNALQAATAPIRLVLASVLIVLLAINAMQVISRRAFTQAVQNMRPISQIDDQELFPEEIDPYQAKPAPGAIVGCVSVQIMIGALSWFVWHYAVAAIGYLVGR